MWIENKSIPFHLDFNVALYYVQDQRTFLIKEGLLNKQMAS